VPGTLRELSAGREDGTSTVDGWAGWEAWLLGPFPRGSRKPGLGTKDSGGAGSLMRDMIEGPKASAHGTADMSAATPNCVRRPTLGRVWTHPVPRTPRTTSTAQTFWDEGTAPGADPEWAPSRGRKKAGVEPVSASALTASVVSWFDSNMVMVAGL
jgi:hypothetical protein